MRGVGRTVFAGDRVEEFQVEVLGVLENIGPRQSLILARLSGGPLDRTGVLQGMSGSPVYLEGRLAGAVAMAFPYAKEPIAGIRPIADMLRVASAPSQPAPQRTGLSLQDKDLTRPLERPQEILAGEARMADIATPISFGGFTRATLERFAPQLRNLGLEPRQGVTGGGHVDPHMGDPSALKPGSMISVQLMTGDLSVGADGTVTAIEGNRIFAFGHRFLSVGATQLPFARAEVLTLLPTITTSFKISAARELMGTIAQDRNTGIYGELGRRAAMVPLSVAVFRRGRPLEAYNMQMISDRLLSPLLLQMATFSAIDATEHTIGAGTFRLSGEIEFRAAPPVKLDSMYAADNGSAMLISLSTAVPVAYLLQSGFDALELKSVRLKVDSFEEKKQLQVDDFAAARRTVRAGETLQLTATFVGENGAEVVRRIDYGVPEGAQPGPLYFTLADANTANLTEYRQYLTTPPGSAAQLVSLINSLRPNTHAYVRVWRAEPSFQVGDGELPDPPPSVALLLTGAQRTAGAISQTQNSKLAEIRIDAGDAMISGAKTIQVDVKE